MKLFLDIAISGRMKFQNLKLWIILNEAILIFSVVGEIASDIHHILTPQRNSGQYNAIFEPSWKITSKAQRP